MVELLNQRAQLFLQSGAKKFERLFRRDAKWLSYKQAKFANFRNNTSTENSDIKKAISEKRREKQERKRVIKKPIVSRVLGLNRFRNAREMIRTFKDEGEIYKPLELAGSESGKQQHNNLKEGSFKILNEYLNRVLSDLDPQQYIEEEYHKKHDQLYCWKFLRELMTVYCFKAEDYKKIREVGSFDVEHVAKIVHATAPKRPIIMPSS
mmetsp:Transcript_4607/g.7808  ORF Transcript_4607/g.7808 Transcript_4607/m.7808 type:complete len:208 (+) Transcript_4607:1271-1894(+)